MSEPVIDNDKIYKEKKDRYDFNKLLEPYKEGGPGPDKPVERNTGVILDWLINKKKFRSDIAGAAFVLVMNELAEGLEFKGDGTYGSKGRQLDRYIGAVADAMNRRRLKLETFEAVVGARTAIIEEMVWTQCRKMMPWWLRLLVPNSWLWLRKRRVKKGNQNGSPKRA